jgi:hypothetical protein
MCIVSLLPSATEIVVCTAALPAGIVELLR